MQYPLSKNLVEKEGSGEKLNISIVWYSWTDQQIVHDQKSSGELQKENGSFRDFPVWIQSREHRLHVVISWGHVYNHKVITICKM